MQEALNVKADKLQSKGVKSVRSRVTNIYPYLKTPITIDEFKETLWRYLIPGGEGKEYILNDEEWAIVHEIKEKRYAKWEWNYGASPECEMEKEARFTGGKLELKLNVTDGLIRDMAIFGDFFGEKDVTELANMLNGKQYRESVIADFLAEIPFEEYFIGITRDEFIKCLFD